ncbi:MAG: Hydrolase, partial [Microbacteriaceae bacterium]|nr:Hydrolase [Microbacteriaceae bacterium]
MTFELVRSNGAPASLARVPGSREDTAPLRIGVVQHTWQPDREALEAELSEAVALAASDGARIVFLPELTLSRYPADIIPSGRADELAEDLESGPTRRWAAEAAAANDVFVHASLYQRTGDDDGRGLNTAIVVSPSGEIVAKTHKLHIPVTAGYYEDKYFRAGPADEPYPVHVLAELPGVRLGMPTCWDEWFPEVARAYGLQNANVVVYPTAIGSEPD